MCALLRQPILTLLLRLQRYSKTCELAPMDLVNIVETRTLVSKHCGPLLLISLVFL